MDDSQCSDIFSDNREYLCESQTKSIDNVIFSRLVSNTKLVLSRNIQEEVLKPSFSTHFCEVLNDCETCISQSLDLAMESLSNADVTQLCENLEDAISILQQLSTFITSVVESISMSCCNMKIFPTTTGKIILAVFTHCKESESLYGSQLKNVERQLKDLFRNCHQLQLTYLMVLEKHLIFDLTDSEELEVLVEALDINLKIGEIAQTLDVKTMAEQWKAYTMICEKHSEHLIHTQMYQNCTQILCKMAEINIRSALENNQDEKIILRSLKVASFTIKILLRVCNIFKRATDKNYDCIIDLLLYIYQNDASYLQIEGKSSQFICLFKTNVMNPSDTLLKELLLDDKFFDAIGNIEMETLEKDDKLLSYILIIVSVIKLTVGQDITAKSLKRNLINCIFQWLPYGHIWFNMGLKYETQVKDEYDTFGLYEYLLTNTYTLAFTLDSEEMSILERKLYETLLSTECYSAIFSSNLWELLLSISPRQLVLNQVVSLSKIYQKLENHKLFPSSPQKVFLSYTISKLYENLQAEDKHRIYKQFSLNDEKNIIIWTVMKVKNLPLDLLNQAEEQITENLKMKFHNVFTLGVQSNEEMDNLIKTMRLAASCSYSDYTDRLEDIVLKAWTRACSCNDKFLLSKGDLDKDSMWYLEYIEALVALTNLVKYVLQNSVNFVQVLHVVSSMLDRGVKELKLVLISLICHMSLLKIPEENKQLAESLLLNTFKSLLHDSESSVKSKFYTELRKHLRNDNVEKIICKVLNEHSSLRGTWNNFIKHGMLHSNSVDIKEQLLSTLKFEYMHKCIESQMCIELIDLQSVSIERGNSSNFEFADIDTLFGAENDSEPASKRVKLDTNDANEILTRLENDAVLLCNVKVNVFTREYRDRIRSVCEKLISKIE